MIGSVNTVTIPTVTIITGTHMQTDQCGQCDTVGSRTIILGRRWWGLGYHNDGVSK